MSRLNKATTLPVKGAPTFKDPADRRAEAVAHSMFTVVGSAVRPVLAGALVSQTVTERAKLLLQELEGHNASEDCVALADQLVQGLKFVCESALDTLPLLSRASAYAVVLRRLVSSKKALVDLPFKGERLFGASLDDIIKDATGGKSTLLLQSGKGKESRRKQGPSFTAPKRFFSPAKCGRKTFSGC